MFGRNVTIINIKAKNKKLYIRSGCSSPIQIGPKLKEKYLNSERFVESLLKYIGQTITIYTTSGGITGEGFTGVLLDVTVDHIKLLNKPQSPPSCPIGNCCDIVPSEKGEGEISLGIMTNIPLEKIAAFVHNII